MVLRSVLALILLVGSSAVAADSLCTRSAVVGDGKQLLWGDLHVHTGYSLDAFIMGTRALPEDAYRFARGAPSRLPNGREVRLERPLDFMAVTDHAEYLAVTDACGPGEDDSAYCTRLKADATADPLRTFQDAFAEPLHDRQPICPFGDARCASLRADAWERIQRAAQDAYEPCAFTTFVANEWTLGDEGLAHLHRNLVFRSAVVPESPINAIDEPTPEAMWRALEARCANVPDCDVIAIPHNTNLSNGLAFLHPESDPEADRLRARFERLVEIVQNKGASECLPHGFLSDESCEFEIRLPLDLDRRLREEDRAINAAERYAVAQGYVREALARGLSWQGNGGVNPFAFGFIGSTDTHSARGGDVEEQGWNGGFGLDWDPAVRRRFTQSNPGGLAGVWAEENTRESIFAALHRRETFATSGPRIALRMRQSSDPDLDLCAQDAPGAVVMGGVADLRPGVVPRFAVQARRDRQPLERIDIIKLTATETGIRQQVFSHRSQGTQHWCLRWEDPQWEPGQIALWYARVLEMPTPRWTAEFEDLDEQVQERAWSSPIFSHPVD